MNLRNPKTERLVKMCTESVRSTRDFVEGFRSCGGTVRAARRLMDTIAADIRYALRTLVRTPGWTLTALLTLAIGTGSNAAVFSFVDALLFKPAPGVRDGRSLVSVFTSDFSSGPYGGSSYPDFISIRRDTTAFHSLAAAHASTVAPLRAADRADRVRVARVTGGYFDLLGVQPLAGRLLAEIDCAPDAAPTVVISASLWDRTFGGTPSIVGQTVWVDGRPYTIVGVAARKFAGIDAVAPIDVWAPLIPRSNAPAERGDRGLAIVGRLREGVTLAQAQAQIDTVADRLARDYPATNLGTLEQPNVARPMRVVETTRIHPRTRGQVVELAAVLMSGVGLVLLLACANVASLLLARGTARTRELAVRRALGASGRRLVRQLVTETAVLAGGSSLLGVLLAVWTADLLPSFLPPEIAASIDATPGLRTVGFALLLATAAALLVGITPALRAVQPSLVASLRGGAGNIAEHGSSRLRTFLVAAQVAIACVLLISAALLAQSVRKQLRADLGFSTRDALLANIELPSTLSSSAGLAVYEAGLARVRALPGVQQAAWARTLPLSRASRRGLRPEGYTPWPGEDLELHMNIVTPAYFETLGVPIVAGRAFGDQDAARLVVVNEALARRFFNLAAVGRHLTDSGGRQLEIVGVARNGRNLTVAEEAPPTVFYSLSQEYSPRMSLIVRTAGASERLADSVRQAVRATSTDAAVFRVVTLVDHVEEALAGERLSAALLSICGLVAATLAGVGLYGALAYLVGRRTREIGIRLALGAQPRGLLLLIARHGLAVAASGIVAGLVTAVGVTTLLRSMLYGIGTVDLPTYGMVAAALLLVAAVAAYLPARRAIRIDPARTLTQPF